MCDNETLPTEEDDKGSNVTARPLLSLKDHIKHGKFLVTGKGRESKRKVLGSSLGLSFLGKVTEHVIIEVTSGHTKDKNVIENSQRGFTKLKSCLTNSNYWSMRYYNEITASMDKRRTVSAV